jgi:hypothetical protein
LYDGKKLIWYSDKDTVAGFVIKEKITAGRKKAYYKNFALGTFYPVTYKDCYPILEESILNLKDAAVKFLKEETIEGIDCYPISVKINAEEIIRDLNENANEIVYEFWISKQDYLPIAFSIDRQIDGNNIFEKHVLTKYEFNKLQDDSVFSLAAIPKHIKLIESEY